MHKSPARSGSATPAPAPAPVSASAPPLPVSMTAESPSAYESTSLPFDEVTFDDKVVSTPTQQVPASVLPSPLSHGPVSAAVVSTGPIQLNLPPQALPPPSASLRPIPSTLPLLHTQSLSPISDQVAPIPLQKIAPSPSASYFDVPISASPTNISQSPIFQSSKSPPLDGAAQSPHLLPSLSRAHASGSAPVSVSRLPYSRIRNCHPDDNHLG